MHWLISPCSAIKPTCSFADVDKEWRSVQIHAPEPIKRVYMETASWSPQIERNDYLISTNYEHGFLLWDCQKEIYDTVSAIADITCMVHMGAFSITLSPRQLNWSVQSSD